MIPYGKEPTNLGTLNMNPEEHMNYLYLPLKLADMSTLYTKFIPERLRYANMFIYKALSDYGNISDHYVYLTAKTLWVDKATPGNRPGWHCDGFGSNGDVNYIWFNMNPTQFFTTEDPIAGVPTDDAAMLEYIENIIDLDAVWDGNINTIYRLDEAVIHRVNPVRQAGIRTFLKLSISKHKYNLKGNSHNYLLNYCWHMYDRAENRNCDNKDFVNSPL